MFLSIKIAPYNETKKESIPKGKINCSLTNNEAKTNESRINAIHAHGRASFLIGRFCHFLVNLPEPVDHVNNHNHN